MTDLNPPTEPSDEADRAHLIAQASALSRDEVLPYTLDAAAVGELVESAVRAVLTESSVESIGEHLPRTDVAALRSLPALARALQRAAGEASDRASTLHPTAVDLRDRLATLLVRRYDRLRRVAYYLHGVAAERLAPELHTREETVTSTPALPTAALPTPRVSPAAVVPRGHGLFELLPHVAVAIVTASVTVMALRWRAAHTEAPVARPVPVVVPCPVCPSPPPPPPPPPPPRRVSSWEVKALPHRGANGQVFVYRCEPDGDPASVWGSEVYTDDSSICTAAVHAGRITFASGGTVSIEVRAGARRYPASSRHGVSSLDYGEWPGSFVVR